MIELSYRHSYRPSIATFSKRITKLWVFLLAAFRTVDCVKLLSHDHLLFQILWVVLKCQNFLGAAHHYLVQHLTFLPKQLNFAKQCAAKTLIIIIDRRLKPKDVILALLRAKPNLFQVYLPFWKLVNMEAFKLTYQVLNNRHFFLATNYL